MAYLKNKKIVFGLITILLGAGVYFVFFKNSDGIEIYKNKQPASLSAALYQNAGKDTDNDGLRDWEEILWKTDPNNPDTDGDGTTDGDEISEKRNPLIKGPDDELSSNDSQANNPAMPKTLVDALGRQILTTTLVSKQTGQTFNPEEIASAIIQDVNLLAEARESTYSFEDIKVSSAVSPEEIRKYGNSLAEIIITAHQDFELLEDEFVIIKEAAENNNQEKLKQLDNFVKGYDSIAQKIIQLPCPSKNIQAHLKLANTYNGLAIALKNIQTGFDDPLLALVGIKQYQEKASLLNQSMSELNTYFISKNVSFAKEESGFLFEETIRQINNLLSQN